jgi:predicted permease
VHTEVAAALQGGGRTASGGRETLRLKNALVASEVALGSALLIAAGLLLRSSAMLQRADHGFRPDGVLTFSVSVRGAAHSDDSQVPVFFERLLDRIGALPGVRSAGAATALPWTGWDENSGFAIVGDAMHRERPRHARYNAVTPDYFRTIGAPLKRGRWLADTDSPTAPPVVLINESLAREYLGDRDPLGRKLDLWGKQREIVGLVGDIKDTPAALTAEPAFYFPQSQVPFRLMSFAVRADVDPMVLAEPIRRAVQTLDPELPIAEVRTLDDVVAAANGQRRWVLALVGLFATLASGLAAVGTYGVITYSVEQRRREIGIRAALGADAGDLVLDVLGQGMRLAAIGLALGVAIALGLGRVLSSLLYGVSPHDPATFALVLPLSAVVAALACLVPAWRASRIDPAEAIRSE